MGMVSLLSTIIYVATFFTMFLAVFSYTAFKLREGRKKKSKPAAPASPKNKRVRLMRAYMVDRVELVGVLKWYDRIGIRMTLMDGREVTVCKNSLLYLEELDSSDVYFDDDSKPVFADRLHTGT